MDIGPNGEKRPDDPISRAVMIAKIATGEIEEEYAEEHETQERPRQAPRRNGNRKRRKAGATPRESRGANGSHANKRKERP